MDNVTGVLIALAAFAIAFGVARVIMYFKAKKQRRQAELQEAERQRAKLMAPQSLNKSKRKRQQQARDKAAK